MSKVKRNLIYQSLYQMLITCLPLITAPYLARVLGAEPLGVFSFTNSIVSYFCLFAMLGVNSYGIRSIAACGTNIKLRSKRFGEIYLFQIVTTVICSFAYLVYFIYFCNENKIIALIQGVNLIAVFTDINWLFFGMEEFKVTVKRNAVIKILSVTLILLLVKTPLDLWKYTLIMASSTFVSNIVLFKFTNGLITWQSIREVKVCDVIQHIKPIIVLFVPLLAMQVYHVMDKTMLGEMRTYIELGYYYNADKVVSTPVGIITGIGITLLPRISALCSMGEDNKSDEYFFISIRFITLLTSGMAFCIAAMSNELVPFFFGDGYDSCILLIIFLSPILIIKGYCYIARMLYLIPNHHEKIYIKSVFVGAFVNLIANILLIPRYGAIGAVLGTVLAEFLSCAFQYVLMLKYISYIKALTQSFIYFPFGLLMFVIIRFSSTIFDNNLSSLIFELLVGAMSFILMCIIYWICTRNKIFIDIVLSLKNNHK